MSLLISSVSPVLGFGFEFSPIQLVVILIIVLLLFGGRVPEVMRNLGRGMSEFKKGMRSLEEETNGSQPQQSNQPYTPPQYQPQLPQQPVYRAPTGAEGQDPRVAQSGYDPNVQQQPMQPQPYPQQPQYQQPQYQPPQYPQQPVPPQH